MNSIENDVLSREYGFDDDIFNLFEYGLVIKSLLSEGFPQSHKRPLAAHSVGVCVVVCNEIGVILVQRVVCQVSIFRLFFVSMKVVRVLARSKPRQAVLINIEA